MGALMYGNHLLLHWSRTQQLAALSSAEAELNASAKAAQEGLGMKNMMDDLGETRSVHLRGDSSVNDGIIKRAAMD